MTDYNEEDFATRGVGYYRTYYGQPERLTGPYETVAELAEATGMWTYPSDGTVVYFGDDDGSISNIPSLNPDDLRVAVEDLREGDLVDLEDDPYANSCTDPDCDEHEHGSNRWAYEYAEVADVTEETPECTAVGFEGAWIGFPRGHRVVVVSRESS